MWMATRQGIDRYDGFSVKYYSLFKDDIRMSDDGQKISISTDGTHDLWAFTDSGRIYRYDAEGDCFEFFTSLASLDIHASLNEIKQIGDRLYACTSDGICCIGITDGSLLHRAMKGRGVKDVATYVDDRLLAGGQGGLSVLTYDLRMSEQMVLTRDLDVECILVDQEHGYIIAGTDGRGAWRYGKDGLNRIHGGMEHAIVRSLAFLDENSIIIGCDGAGVFTTSREGGRATLFATDLVPDGDLSLRTSSVYSVLVDDGNIWVASYRGGVTLFRKDADVFLIRDMNEKVVSANFVHSICEGKDGDLWMAFNASVGHYDFETGQLRKYLDKAGGFLSVALDDEGFVWCGGYNTGTYRLDSESGKSEFLPSLSTGTEQDCIYSIRKDSEGHIWVGGLNFDLARFTVSGRSLSKRQYPLKEVSDILPISRDTLLLGTNNGLYILDQESGNITSVSLSGNEGRNVTSVINCLSYADVSREVWIGTEGGGLLCYSLDSGDILPFSTHDGIPSNYITGMQIDNLQRLWVSTENSGLFVLDLPTRKVVSALDRREGLFSNEFFPSSSCLLSGGDVVFGGYYGAVVIPTLAQFNRPEFGRISFNELRVGNEKVTMKTHPGIVDTPIDGMKKMKLPYRARSFSLSVGTDDLYNQNAARLYWRLRGSFDQWRVVGVERIIEANNLAPGDYVLEIRGDQHTDGTYVSRSVSIAAKQVFWLEWYAILVYILLAGLLAYLLIINYNHYLEKQSLNEKIGFFTNVAHDIRTPLTLVSAPLDKLDKLLADQPLPDEERYLIATARNNVKHLDGMVSQLMELGRMSTQDGTPELQPVDIKAYLEMLRYDFSLLCDEKGIDFNVETAPGTYNIYTDARLFGRIIDNLVSNAIKYTFEGCVTVRLSGDGSQIRVEVADTGIGILPEDAKKLFKFCHRGRNAVAKGIPGNGVGLFFTYTIVKKMGGDLTFQSTQAKGSTFCLTLPTRPAEVPSEAPVPEESEAPVLKPAGHSVHKETILLAEDNDGLREFMVHALSEHYNVLDVPCADDALTLLHEHSIDLVLSDIVMPGMHGDALCRQIKSHIETSHIPVILVSGISDKEAVATGLSGGADDYITKPVDIDLLELKIHSIFENRKKLHSWYLSRMNIKKPDPLQEKKPLQTDLDGLFLQKLAKTVQDNLSNTDFSVNDLCNEVAMSRTLLYEKTRKLLGMAPNDFIREIRMKQAKALLEEGRLSVTVVAGMCGFSDVRYFSTAFKKYFNISPSKVAPSRQEA